ncbi:MAG: purine-nucleoside phosphorylase [Coriobacteriales bacterium]|jgi:purine-nucleoside phosphorylase|nr:purine-nucleoside phosphorylase [Coriobacteriales bacterium]
MLAIQTRVNEATEAVLNAWQATDDNADETPDVIITTGSGLGALTAQVSPVSFEISYAEVPHLPASRVIGHAGRLVIGRLGAGGRKVVVLDGRVHGYEGHDPLTQVLPFLIAHQLCGGSVRLAVFTNAAGAINEYFHTGELMLIADHINLTGQTLVEFNEESDFGGRNLDMTFAYTPAYRRRLEALAREHEIKLHQGVYVAVKGAMFETPAEIIAFRRLGGDAVGMSTVHEVCAASRLGIDAVGISVLTNMAAGIEAKVLTHKEVLENTAKASSEVSTLITSLLAEL